jgi:hypothetical protein
MAPKQVWFVFIEIPKDLLDDIKEGSIDLAGQTIDLEELDDSYDEDLDKDNGEGEEENPQQPVDMGMGGMPPPAAPGAPPM